MPIPMMEPAPTRRRASSRASVEPRSGRITIAGPYLGSYAGEMAWREDHRRVSNGELYLLATNATLRHPVSRQWKGYWQRAAA